MGPDKNWLLQNYWIDQTSFPTQATHTGVILKEIVNLNPTHLKELEVSQRVILEMVRAVWEEHFEEAEFVEHLGSVVSFLVNYQGSEEIHLQLQNLVGKSEFTLGNVSLVPISNQGDLTEHNLKYDTHSLRSNDVTSVNAYAKVTQAPGLGTAASWNAVQLTERVLKVVRGVGLPTVWGRDWGQMGVTGRVVGSGWTILRTGHGYWNSGIQTNSTPGTWYMDLERMLSNFTADEIGRLKAIYEKKTPSKLENKALQSLIWLGEATFPAEKASKFAYLSIAFESAVGGEANDEVLKEIGITQMLAERTAFLLGRSLEQRRGWHRAVTKLYGSRSRVMHGDSDPVSDSELTRWALLVWKAARATLRISADLSNVEQLADWVRTQRYLLP